jgi:hypothetical protein
MKHIFSELYGFEIVDSWGTMSTSLKFCIQQSSWSADLSKHLDCHFFFQVHLLPLMSMNIWEFTIPYSPS